MFSLLIKTVHGVHKDPSLLLNLSPQSLISETLKQLCLGLAFLGFQQQESPKVFLRIRTTNVCLAWCSAVTGFQVCLMTKVSSQIGDDKEIRMTVMAGRAQVV